MVNSWNVFKYSKKSLSITKTSICAYHMWKSEILLAKVNIEKIISKLKRKKKEKKAISSETVHQAPSVPKLHQNARSIS